jgi:hypothetical protein
MRDEIAAFLLDTFPLDKNTLAFVANHVANSPGRPSCLMERVPLQFVFGADRSLGYFLQVIINCLCFINLYCFLVLYKWRVCKISGCSVNVEILTQTMFHEGIIAVIICSTCHLIIL